MVWGSAFLGRWHTDQDLCERDDKETNQEHGLKYPLFVSFKCQVQKYMKRMTLNGGWLEFFMDELTNRAVLVYFSPVLPVYLSACLPVLPYKELVARLWPAKDMMIDRVRKYGYIVAVPYGGRQ
jgi:hypothetical protein